MIEFYSDTDYEFPESLNVAVVPAIERILSDYNKTLNYIHVVFMDDEQLLEINREFLRHDYYTDIITFNYADDEDVIESELYISITRVNENAINEGVSFNHELKRVIIHGILHLVGFEDSTESFKNVMQLAEDKYINLIVSRETL